MRGAEGRARLARAVPETAAGQVATFDQALSFQKLQGEKGVFQRSARHQRPYPPQLYAIDRIGTIRTALQMRSNRRRDRSDRRDLTVRNETGWIDHDDTTHATAVPDDGGAQAWGVRGGLGATAALPHRPGGHPAPPEVGKDRFAPAGSCRRNCASLQAGPERDRWRSRPYTHSPRPVMIVRRQLHSLPQRRDPRTRLPGVPVMPPVFYLVTDGRRSRPGPNDPHGSPSSSCGNCTPR